MFQLHLASVDIRLLNTRIVARMSKVGDREPVQGENKQGRTLFFVILVTIVALLVVFLVLRPRGSQAGPPQTTHAQ